MLQQHNMQLNGSRASRRRSAFTMVELIIVIMIIGILMALLLPTIGRTLSNGRNAAVTAEIKNLEKAIAEFKLKFGVEPPSSIVLYENGVASGDTPNWDSDSSRDLARRRSVAFIKQAFPNFDFDLERDFNGDADTDDTLTLTGAECLLFFLGGMCATEDAAGGQISGPTGPVGTPGTVPDKWFPLGFSTNPENPFIRTGTRIGPFYEFDPGRIVNVNPTDPLKGMPEYLDSLPGQTAPYLYASANGGRGYNAIDSDSDGDIDFHADLALGADAPITSPTFIYFSSGIANSDGDYPASAVPYNANSYQILSPGQDQQYGPGGSYSRDDGFDDYTASGAFSTLDVSAQDDNITNFSSGRMRP